MAYNIYKSNGDLLSIVDDGFADINSASVALIGKNFPGYGQYFNENFIRLTENFSSDNAPDNQLTGQLWYQTSTSQLKIWNSTEWVSAGKPNIVNDNASANLAYVAGTYISSFKLDYTIKRGDFRRTGTLTAVKGQGSTGTGFTYADDYYENGSTGVTLIAAADGANVRVSYTASSTGSDGTINYSITNLG